MLTEEVNARGSSRLAIDRRPASVEEARTMVEYNERILATSVSPQRRHRAERMLANVLPLLAELERAAADRLRQREVSALVSTFASQLPPARPPQAEELETVWDGTRSRHGQSLSGEGMGSSLAPGPGHRVSGLR